jgi:predicted SAM-dependent methyltransferase
MKLNIGSGTLLMEDAINMDIRRLPDTVCGDIRNIPFGDGYFDEVYATDIIEHMTAADGLTALREISRVLRPSGKAFFQLPSLRGIMEAYAAGATAEKVSWWLFGGQDYKENYHFVVYDEKSFQRALLRSGLTADEFIFDGTNMKVTARKNA